MIELPNNNNIIYKQFINKNININVNKYSYQINEIVLIYNKNCGLLDKRDKIRQ